MNVVFTIKVDHRVWTVNYVSSSNTKLHFDIDSLSSVQMKIHGIDQENYLLRLRGKEKLAALEFLALLLLPRMILIHLHLPCKTQWG